jgi:hypothetical protein
MKHALIFIAGLLIVLSTACSKKDENSTPTVPLVFNSLEVSDSVMTVNGILTCTASATGDGISYHWSATYGSFVGSGSTVSWTVCHADNFVITCEVKDSAGNSAKKQRTVRVHH